MRGKTWERKLSRGKQRQESGGSETRFGKFQLVISLATHSFAMPLLVDYGSDDDSGSDAGEQSVTAPPPPPPKPSGPMPKPAVASSSSGLQLPPPKSNSRRRDGPVKIKVEAPKPLSQDEESEKLSKRQRTDEPSMHTKGAGASSLLSMLPAPKTTTISLPKPTRVLGGGSSSRNDDPGVVMHFEPVTSSEIESTSTADDSTTVTSFVPSSTVRPKARQAPPKTAPPKPAAPAVDFFSLGTLPRHPFILSYTH